MDSSVVVHMGTIASGEIVIRNGQLRDRLAEEYGVLCFERWRRRERCPTSLAYARQLFFHMPIDEVKRLVSSLDSH
jgi:hypothetical protein